MQVITRGEGCYKQSVWIEKGPTGQFIKRASINVFGFQNSIYWEKRGSKRENDFPKISSS